MVARAFPLAAFAPFGFRFFTAPASCGTRAEGYVVEDARAALRRSRLADPAAVKDQQMREHRPPLAREDLHQRRFDLHRLDLLREAEPLTEARDVGVDDDPLVLPEGIAEDDVRRLPAHAGKAHELFHRRRHVTAVALDHGRRHAEQALRLVPEEAGTPDDLLESLGSACDRALAEGYRANSVGVTMFTRLVGALRAEDRRAAAQSGVR